MFFYFLIILYVLLFFLVIPGIGGLAVRRRWRVFRASLLQSLNCPLLDNLAFQKTTKSSYRFFGHLEAIQDNDLLWVNNGNQTVSVSMKNESIYILPANAELDLNSPYKGRVRKVDWTRTGILSQGLGVFVCGGLSVAGGLPYFSRQPGRDFLVILFDGAANSVLARSIWYGRQQNEYWNDYTPFSLLTGFVALLSLAIIGFQEEAHRFMAIIAAASALIPFMPLMPPGILALFLYRRLWRQGRSLRARKDLLLLGDYLLQSPEFGQKQIYTAAGLDYAQAKRVLAERGGFTLDIPLLGNQGPAGTAVLYQPKGTNDPLALTILVQGDPATRLSIAQRSIHRNEISSLVILGIGLALNFYLCLVLIIQIINYGWINIR